MANLTDIHPGARRSPPHILTLILLVGIPTLAMNVFLPSLPAMAEYFAVDYSLMQLSVGLFLVMNAALQLFVGPLSDHYGRRPVILIGLVLFVLATIGCIWAPTAKIFLMFRMAQAAVVFAMVLSRAVVRDLYPQDKAASMLGYVTMGMSIVPMIGPAFGGWLGSIYGWHANFWLLLGAGVFLFVLTWFDLGETAPKTGGSFREQAREYPELLTSRRFWGYCAASALASGTFFAYLGGVPFVGTRIFDMDPATLGIFFGAPAIGYFIGNFLSGRFSQRIGIDHMILAGAVGQVCGLTVLAALTAGGLTSHWVFFGFMTFVGLGNGMVIPNATSGMLSVRPQLAGTASGLGGAMMIGGGAALSGVAGWILVGASTALPLVLLMVTSGIGSVIAILLTIRRNRQLGG